MVKLIYKFIFLGLIAIVFNANYIFANNNTDYSTNKIFKKTATTKYNLYLVSNIKLKKETKNIRTAKSESLQEAKYMALDILQNRLNAFNYNVNLNNLNISDSDFSYIISSIEIIDEIIKDNFYELTINILFSKTNLQKLIKQTLPQNQQTQTPILIIPIYQINQEFDIWSKNNQWMGLWEQMPSTNSNIKIIDNNIENMEIISPRKLLSSDNNELINRLKQKYKVDKIAIALARHNYFINSPSLNYSSLEQNVKQEISVNQNISSEIDSATELNDSAKDAKKDVKTLEENSDEEHSYIDNLDIFLIQMDDLSNYYSINSNLTTAENNKNQTIINHMLNSINEIYIVLNNMQNKNPINNTNNINIIIKMDNIKQYIRIKKMVQKILNIDKLIPSYIKNNAVYFKLPILINCSKLIYNLRLYNINVYKDKNTLLIQSN